jgi:hypothetical protein
LSISERCEIYHQQQSVIQNGTEEGDDQLNYAAYMEYQSLEKSVKESHIHILTELRDFWTAIRSNEAVSSTASRLSKIAVMSRTTDAFYESIIKRYPDARNAHILYSRYLLKVNNDKDKAAAYQNNGEMLKEAQKNDENRSEVSGGNGNEDKSEGKSSRTSASKEARLLKQKRDLLFARLSAPVQDVMKRIKFFAVLFIALITATIAVCKITLDKTKSSLDGLTSAMVPRRYSWVAYTDIRGKFDQNICNVFC